MKTKATYTVLLSTLLIPVFNAHALGLQASTSVNLQGPRMEARQEIKSERINHRMELRASTTPGTPERKMMRTALRAELTAKIKELRDSIKVQRHKQLEEKAQIRVVVKLDKIFDALTEKVDRLTRVDAEITKRLAARTNTATVVSLQVTAQAALAKAKLDVEAAKEASVEEVKTTTSKEALRVLVTTAEASVKTAAAEYKKVVEAMKDLPKIQVTASSSINN